MPRFDDVIIGGGLAGLTFACELQAAARGRRRVLVLEAREHYEDDRTWGAWNVAPHAFESLVSRRWTRWEARWGGRVFQHGPAEYAYETIRAGDFYRAAQRRIEAARRSSLQMGTTVGSVEDHGEEWRVETSAGVFTARHVLDARCDASPRAELLQHFAGWRVRTERPAFAPNVATLMDLDVDQSRGPHFFYVLPDDAHSALVEATWITPQPHEPEAYERAIAGYLHRRYGVREFEIEAREAGAIPMTVHRPRIERAPGWYRIGTAAGLVKPSTGYAFPFVQRWSQQMARRLVQRDRPTPPAARGAVAHRMDAVFLSVLRRTPERTPELFARMFERIDGATFARFLSEEATAADLWRVVRAMPAAPFLKEAARTMAGATP